LKGGTKRLSGVFDYIESMLLSRSEQVPHILSPAIQVNRDNGQHFRVDQALQCRPIKVQRLGRHIAQYWFETRLENRLQHRRAAVGWDDDLRAPRQMLKTQ
jgi:hypothetical protein